MVEGFVTAESKAVAELLFSQVFFEANHLRKTQVGDPKNFYGRAAHNLGILAYDHKEYATAAWYFLIGQETELSQSIVNL